MTEETTLINNQQSPGAALTYSFTLLSFEEIIKQNFKLVQKLLDNQHQSIDQLKLQVQQLRKIKTHEKSQTIQKPTIAKEKSEKKQKIIKQEPTKTETNQQTKQKKEAGVSENVQVDFQKPPSTEQQVQVNFEQTPHPQVSQEKQAIIQVQEEQKEVEPPKEQQRKETLFSTVEKEALQSKMFQLFERVRQLQQKQLFGSRQIQQNFKQIQYSLSASNKALEKMEKTEEQYEQDIEKLRNQLSEYKLKKEAKLNKLLQANALTHSSLGNNQSFDYIAQKLQFLLKHVKELLPKRTFQQERQIIQQNLDGLRKKVNQSINVDFFQQSLKNVEIKIYHTVVKYIKAIQAKQQRKQNGQEQNNEEQQNELQNILAQADRQLSQKVSSHQQKLKQLQQQLQLNKAQTDLSRKQKLQTDEEWSQHLKDIQQYQHKLKDNISITQKKQQELTQKINRTQIENQTQIIELQEQVQKINSHIKTYIYAYGENKASPNRKSPETTQNQNNILDTSAQLQQQKEEKITNNNPLLEQELNSLKKKLNKNTIKLQGLKEDILNFRNDFTREIDGLKMSLQKKSDWDSLKKALAYFDQKFKETKIIMEHLYNSFDKNQAGDQSLAVKRGWTCLMCDRDIRHFEGKLSEAKFTSMFPVRESPRIGGYYKQQQASQQYKQVFLSNPSNNRGKRIGSLRSHPTNNSKQQLQG